MDEDDVGLACASDVLEHLATFPGGQEGDPAFSQITEAVAINGCQPSLLRVELQSRVGSGT